MDAPDGTVWTILKWVLLVLVAGFIGQFGKAMAESILERLRSRGGKGQGSGGVVTTGASLPEAKTPPAEDGTSPREREDLPGEKEDFSAGPVHGPLDKKVLKALAKREKKLAKLKKKA